MLIGKVFETAESESAARELIGRYLESQGFRLRESQPDLVYERGSALGSRFALSTKKWHAVVRVRTQPNDDQSTQVTAEYGIDTTGQMVVKREMANWEQEIAGLVQSVAGYGVETSPLAQEVTRLQTKRAANEGANWFFWIAGLSLANSILGALGGGFTFVVGLGATQLIDALALILMEQLGPSTILRVAAFGLDVLAAGIFVVFGLLARRHKVGYIIGMVVYALDMLIFVWARDVLSILFHLYALYGLFRGLQSLKRAQQPPAVAAA